jgi:dienelactone hydrolase
MNGVQVFVEKTTIASIPALVIKPQQAGKDLPTVLLYHGWSGSVENYRFFATMLALFGFQVVAPEIPLHGERGNLPQYYSPEGFAHFWDVMNGGVEEGRAIVQELVAKGLAEPKRIGVVGHSLGGGIAAALFAHHPEIEALVCINGASAFEFGEVLWRSVDGRPPATEEELSKVRQFDPMQRRDRFFPRPALFLHGKADTSVPLQVAKKLYEALQPLYANQPERLRLETYPNLNHHITLSMLEETVNWFIQHIANVR